MKKTRPHKLSLSSNPSTAFQGGGVCGRTVGSYHICAERQRSGIPARRRRLPAGFQRKPLVHQNKKGTPAGAIFYFGGPDRDRTGDLTDANRTLSQLSYRPIIRAPEQIPMLCISYFIIAGVPGEFKGKNPAQLLCWSHSMATCAWMAEPMGRASSLWRILG